jgi:hypothetical protein
MSDDEEAEMLALIGEPDEPGEDVTMTDAEYVKYERELQALMDSDPEEASSTPAGGAALEEHHLPAGSATTGSFFDPQFTYAPRSNSGPEAGRAALEKHRRAYVPAVAGSATAGSFFDPQFTDAPRSYSGPEAGGAALEAHLRAYVPADAGSATAGDFDPQVTYAPRSNSESEGRPTNAKRPRLKRIISNSSDEEEGDGAPPPIAAQIYETKEFTAQSKLENNENEKTGFSFSPSAPTFVIDNLRYRLYPSKDDAELAELAFKVMRTVSKLPDGLHMEGMPKVLECTVTRSFLEILHNKKFKSTWSIDEYVHARFVLECGNGMLPFSKYAIDVDHELSKIIVHRRAMFDTNIVPQSIVMNGNKLFSVDFQSEVDGVPYPTGFSADLLARCEDHIHNSPRIKDFARTLIRFDADTILHRVDQEYLTRVINKKLPKTEAMIRREFVKKMLDEEKANKKKLEQDHKLEQREHNKAQKELEKIEAKEAEKAYYAPDAVAARLSKEGTDERTWPLGKWKEHRKKRHIYLPSKIWNDVKKLAAEQAAAKAAKAAAKAGEGAADAAADVVKVEAAAAKKDAKAAKAARDPTFEIQVVASGDIVNLDGYLTTTEDDYNRTGNVLKETILAMPKKELLERMFYTYPGNWNGGRKEDNPDAFKKLFAWVQKYPAWYLRWSIWALQIRHYHGSMLQKARIDVDINSPAFAPNWLKRAPKTTEVNKKWDALTMQVAEPADIWNKTPAVREIYRPPTAFYQGWDNPDLDLSFPESTIREDDMRAIVEGEAT